MVKAIVNHSLFSLAKEEIANSKDKVKTIILETNKNRISLLMIAMVLLVKDKVTTSHKLARISGDKPREEKFNKERIRQDRIREDRIREERIRKDRIKEDRTKLALVKEMALETNKYRVSLLMIVMVLQVKDRATTIPKLVRVKGDKSREGRIKEDRTKVALSKEMVLETNKYRTSLLMKAMVLQVMDQKTTSSKLVRDKRVKIREDKTKEYRIREDKFKVGRLIRDKIKTFSIREPFPASLVLLDPSHQLSTDSCHYLSTIQV